MKKLYNYRRFIASVLSVTVSLMLFVFTIPASAENYKVQYYSCLPNSGIQYFGSSQFIDGYATDTAPLNSGANATLFHTSNFASLGHISADENLNGDFFFSFEAPPMWAYAFETGAMEIGIVIQAYNGENYAFSGNTGIEFNVINQVGKYVFRAGPSRLASFVKYKGWKQADIIGIGIKNNSNYSGNFSVRDVSYVQSYEQFGFVDGEFKWYSPIARTINYAFDYLTSVLVKCFSVLGEIMNGIWQYMKPFLKPILEEVFIPTLNGLLSAVVSIASEVGKVLSPLIADIINFFSPYFIQVMEVIGYHFSMLVSNLLPLVAEFVTQITPSFVNIMDAMGYHFSMLVSNLFPLINEFVTAIGPSYEAIVSSLTRNISNIFSECFIPNETSTEYQDFVGMKNDVSNKFPIFIQLKSFFNSLFNPELYGDSLEDYSYSLLQNYGTFSLSSTGFIRKQYFDFNKDRSYILSFTAEVPSGGSSYIEFHAYNASAFGERFIIHNGLNTFKFSPNQDFNTFHFECKGTGNFIFSNVFLYSLESINMPSDFTVNVYGSNVSVLNFDWYMPYKRYGDICVIAFCYLAFVWHTFKRLPSII